MLAAMAALRRVIILFRVIIPVRSIMPIIPVMVFGIMDHMKADCPLIMMMMRYRSRHQHDQYR